MTLSEQKPVGLFRSTFIITIFSFLNISIGFITQVVLAKQFGIQWKMDAFLTGSTLPSLITTVFLGSLNVTLVPVFIEYKLNKSREEAWDIASSFINLSGLFLVLVVFLAELLAVQLTALIAPGYNPEGAELSTSLLRIMLPNILFSGIAGLIAGICYAHKQFLLPSVATVLNSLTILSVTLIFVRDLDIYAVALGTLLGGITQFLIYIPWIIRKRGYKFTLDWQNEGVRKIISLTLPLISAALVFRANSIIDRMIASTLPEGSVSILGYALKITSVLVVISTSGLSISVFPLLSQYAAKKENKNISETFQYGMRLAAMITLPIACTIIILRIPIVQLLLERGQFQESDTEAISRTLIPYMVTMVFMGIAAVVSQGYYIFQDTVSLAKVGIIQIGAYIIYTYILAKSFSYIGIALASCFLYGLSILIHLKFIGLKLGHFQIRETTKVLFMLLISALVGAIGARFAHSIMEEASQILDIIVAGSISILIYLLFIRFIFKVNDIYQFEHAIRRKLSF